MVRLESLPFPEIHVHAAGKARIETANRTHDVDALELVRSVLFEYRRVLYGVFVRSGRAIDIAWIGIPRSRRIWVVVGDLPAFDHDVMREDAAYRFVKAAADGFVRNF